MIDAYSFGSITVNGKTFRSDVIIYPDRIRDSWWRKEGHSLCIDDIQEVLDFHPEVLVIGMGNPGLMKVPQEVAEEIKSHGIKVVVDATKQAVKKFNDLCRTKRVVGAFHITC